MPGAAPNLRDRHRRRHRRSWRPQVRFGRLQTRLADRERICLDLDAVRSSIQGLTAIDGGWNSPVAWFTFNLTEDIRFFS